MIGIALVTIWLAFGCLVLATILLIDSFRIRSRRSRNIKRRLRLP